MNRNLRTLPRARIDPAPETPPLWPKTCITPSRRRLAVWEDELSAESPGQLIHLAAVSVGNFGPPTRFDLARAEAAERATFHECCNALTAASNAIERARSLLNTAIGADPTPRALSRAQAARSTVEALQELEAVVAELR